MDENRDSPPPSFFCLYSDSAWLAAIDEIKADLAEIRAALEELAEQEGW